ncbi:MAG: ABC transporter substrate-binding protein [Thermonemataceae bacterium]
MRAFVDQMKREVILPQNPQRIISLVPSQTELLFDLGLEDQIVGRTKFCIHPQEKVKDKTIVGGTKHFRFDAIDALEPDLIIGNKEENYLEGIERLSAKYPVWMSDITTLVEAYEMIIQVGQLTETVDKAQQLVDEVKKGFKQLYVNNIGKERFLRVAYFIWQRPLMAAGSQTFIDEILTQIGFENIFGDIARYPEIQEETLVEAQPDAILLSSEPYPFKEKHLSYFKELCPQSDVRLVDGEMFSWYGSRLTKATNYLSTLVEEMQATIKKE